MPRTISATDSEVDIRQAHVELEQDINSRARGVSLEYS